MSEEPWASGIMMEKLDLSIELHSEEHPKITAITQNRWEMSRSGDRMICRSLERSVPMMHKMGGYVYVKKTD